MSEYFENVKVGDEVFSTRRGLGEVTTLEEGCDYPVVVDFKNGEYDTYTLRGGSWIGDNTQELFWAEDSVGRDGVSLKEDNATEASTSYSEEYTGGSVGYYKVWVESPTTATTEPYMAECNDIIEALGMNYSEGNAFKAIWRKAAARTLGMSKKGYTDGLYDSEKVVFFGERMVVQEKSKQGKSKQNK